jgi:hypothetical protein
VTRLGGAIPLSRASFALEQLCHDERAAAARRGTRSGLTAVSVAANLLHVPPTAVPAVDWCVRSGDDVSRVQKACAAGADEHRRPLGDCRPNRLGDRISGPIRHASRHKPFDHAVPPPLARTLRHGTALASSTHTRPRL